MTIEAFEIWQTELGAFGSDDDTRETLSPGPDDAATDAFEATLAEYGEWQARLAYTTSMAALAGLR